mgnify:CR=1
MKIIIVFGLLLLGVFVFFGSCYYRVIIKPKKMANKDEHSYVEPTPEPRPMPAPTPTETQRISSTSEAGKKYERYLGV